MTVYNRPETDYIYEFEVVIPMSGGMYMHDLYHTNGFIAEQRAIEVGGIIIHNIRVAGKRLAD